MHVQDSLEEENGCNDLGWCSKISGGCDGSGNNACRKNAQPKKSIKNSLNGMEDKKAHKMHTLLLLWNGT